MTSSAARTTAASLADPLEVFTLRCRAKAALVAAADLDLVDAVDELQAAAVATGLVQQIGQDAVQAMMSEAFQRLEATT